MRVKILEDRLSDMDPEAGHLYVQHKDDTLTVPDTLGTKWVGHGWAEDVDGVVPTGSRIVVGATVRPDSVDSPQEA